MVLKSGKRIIVIGGVSSTDGLLETVTSECAEYCNASDADYFNFKEAMGDSWHSLSRSVEGACSIITHSAGLMALDGVVRSGSPESIVAISPPVPSSAARLVAKVAVRNFNDCIEFCCKAPDARFRNDRNKQLLASYFSELNPKSIYRNVGQGRLRGIARFDSLRFAGRARRDFDTLLGVVYPRRDELFRPCRASIDEAVEKGVYVKQIEGRHDDFLIDAKKVLGRAAILSFLENGTGSGLS